MEDHVIPASGPPQTGGPFEALYREYAPFVHRLALRMGLGAQDAEDAVHDIFLAVHDDYSSFRREASPKTWIYRVAVNHCLNRLRGLRRSKSFPWSLLGRRPDPPAPAPSEERGVLELLALLSPKLRAAVVLKDVEELSYEELARALEISPGTAMSRVARGREELRKLLSKSTEEKE